MSAHPEPRLTPPATCTPPPKPAPQRPAPREALLNGPALLIMTAIIAIALYVLFPRQPAFRDPQNLRASDALSIAYLRVLVRSDPDNVPLRLSFVQLLTEAGLDSEAIDALTPLLDSPAPAYAFEIGLAQIRLQLQQLFRYTEAEPAEALRAIVRDRFVQLQPLAQRAHEQDALLIEARKFGEPAILAAVLTELLQRPDSVAARRGRQLAEIAALQLAANAPDLAARRWQEAFPLLPAAEQSAAAEAALRAYLAAGELARALPAARHFVSTGKPTPALLALAADVAQQNGDDAQARQWLYALRPFHPDDDTLTERLLALELALGDLPAALILAQELAPTVIPGSDRQRLLARSFDWNGDGAAALPHWFALAQLAPDPESENRALALALAHAAHDHVVALVTAASMRRRLAGDEASALVDSGLRIGEPQPLQQTLHTYLQREPGDRAGWVALARLHAAAGEPTNALQAWQRAEGLARLQPGERLAIAENYWRSGQPEPALNSLLPLSSSPPAGAEARYWQLMAELGWALERQNVARPAYQQLLARYQPNDRLAIDRLLQLAVASGDDAAIERQAYYGWSRLRARHYFVVLLELAARRGDGARLDQLLAEASQQQARFANEPRYWQYRAERASLRGDFVAARDHLQQLAQVRVNDPDVIEALMWLLLAGPVSDNVALNQLAERYSSLAEGDAVLAEVMAVAEHQLGRPANAARWYALTLPARSRDLPWLLTVADNLEWLGCTVTANQFRLRSLQQLQRQSPPLPKVEHRQRLADRFFGRDFFTGAFAERLADMDDADDIIELAELWQLQTPSAHPQLDPVQPNQTRVNPIHLDQIHLDNARWFALRWQLKRLQTNAWEALADEWTEQNPTEIAAMLSALQTELALAPEGPLSSSVLPLSLNDVAARSWRFGASRSELPPPDPARELPICKQTLAQFSALALPLPANGQLLDDRLRQDSQIQTQALSSNPLGSKPLSNEPLDNAPLDKTTVKP